MLYKIGIWGQYGDGGQIADGQAVRTTVITKELQNRYGANNIHIVNTNNWKKHPIKFLWNSIKLVATSQKVIIAPADNGFKVFVPLLVFVNIIFHRDLLYIVIGGFLPALLKQKPIYCFFVHKFSAIFVQTDNIKNDLENLGINNIFILSNLKRLNTIKENEVIINNESEIKVCVFSRINKEKGIEDAIEAVKLVNQKLGSEKIKLDLYGLLPDFYKSRLSQLIDDNKSFVQYKGIVDYDKTVETLCKYFVMLFPTYYHGEGFPGNVIDAYNSALPIIATDWLYNKDVIHDGENGILVPIKSPKAIAEAIIILYSDRTFHHNLSLNNLHASYQYTPDMVLKEFYDIIDNK